MPLIGKERGGHRAITTASSLYRLWGRLRRPWTQQWEAAHDRPYFAAGKGRRPHDVVWRQLVRAEAGDAQGLTSATVLWDMASFYDTINRTRLWRMVSKYDFPIVIARLAFSMYDAPRAVTLDGRLARPAFGRNGIPAGCPFANALTRLYCVEPFDELAATLRSRFDDVTEYDAYIDDLTMTAVAEEGDIVRIVIEAADLMKDTIEYSMGCEIESDKAAVLSSSPKAAAAIARRLGALGGSDKSHVSAINLGCDFAPARRRTAQGRSGKRKARYRMLRRRVHKLARARRAIGRGRRSRRIFCAGPLAAAVHDAAVNGVSDAEALVLRRAAATACTPRARGRSLALVTIMHQIPTWRAEVEVVLQYARQVWAAGLQGHHRPTNGALGLTKIAELWRAVDKEAIFAGTKDHRAVDAHPPPHHDPSRHPAAAHDEVHEGQLDAHTDARGRRRATSIMAKRAEATWKTDGRRRLWSEVKGPIGATILTLHRLGWRMVSPFVLVDDWGEEIPLTKTAPALLETLLREATFRALETYVGSKVAKDDLDFDGRRTCTDHLRRQLASDSKITTEGRAAYLSVLCGAVMTYHRAAKEGYMVQDVCPLCGCRGDTIFHRVWKCLHPDAVAARCRASPQWFRDEIDRGTVNRTLCTTGMIPHPGDVWPRPARDAIPSAHYEGDGERPIAPEGIPIIDGSVYVDGSCTNHVIPELKRAGTSLVTKNQQGHITWRINLAVPTPMPQTSQASEFVALPLVQAYLRGTSSKLDVASDCLNVVRSCHEPAARALCGSKLYAGLLKPVRADPAWRDRVVVRKVPAHIDPRTLPHGDARDDAIANGVADTEAKRAVGLHPQPAPAQIQMLEAELRRARCAVRTIAAVMPVFPPMPRERMVRPPPLFAKALQCMELVGTSGSTRVGTGDAPFVGP